MGGTWSQEPAAAAGPPSSSRSQSLTEAIKALARANRTHKMVFVANMSLKMGAGKLAAQVGHAAIAVYQQAQKSVEGQAALQSWEAHGVVKIVVKGESTEQLKELYAVAQEKSCYCYLIRDAGFTQIAPGSITILGIFGEKENVDAVTGSLKLL